MWFRTKDPDDPRHRVTETGFRVDPDLLGRPLAHPLRRLGAVLVDLSAVGALVLSRVISPWLFALVGAWLLWRVADPDADVRLRSEGLRTTFRWTALATAGVAAIVMIAGMFSGDEPEDDVRGPTSAAVPAGGAGGTGPGGPGTGNPSAPDSTVPAGPGRPSAVERFRSAPTVEEARERAAGLALEVYRRGYTRDQVEDSVDEALEAALEEEERIAWSADREAVVDSALTRMDSVSVRRAGARDSLLAALAAAADTGSPARVRALASRVLGTPPPAGRRQLEERIEHLRDELEAARQPPSLIDFLRGVLNDLGLGLGWLGVYFTASLALWRGRTPGKRLFGIRVVRIDGEDLTTWDAFGRFGGYAASVLTGLLGFAQLLWDANRQALHDRIAGTVVVEE